MKRCAGIARSYATFIFLLTRLFATSTMAFSLPSLMGQESHSKVPISWKRDNGNVSIPSAISIAPSQEWDGIDGPWSSFALQVGSGSVSGAQTVRIFISTAATDIWTIGAKGCPSFYGENCFNERGRLFYPNESLTWQAKSTYAVELEVNLGMDTSGPAGYDTATLGWQGSGGPTVPHNVVFNLAAPTYWLGVFGLNPRPTNFTNFNDPQPSFMQQLYDNNKIPSLSYGYTAGAQYRLDSVFGSMVLGGYDSNKFVANNVTFDFYEDISRDLSVNLQGIETDQTVISNGPTNLLPDGTISIFIDSTIAELWLPISACTAFEDAFGIEYSDSYEMYLLNSSQRQTLLDKDPSVKFTIGPDVSGGQTVDISLPYRAFDKQVTYPLVRNSSYYFPLQRAANSTQYTLGRTFLQEAYLIADYNRNNFSVSQCDWSQSNVNTQKIINILSPANAAKQQTTNSNNNSGSSISVGVIVGIIIALVAAIALLGLALFFIRRRKQRNQAIELEGREPSAMAKMASSADNNAWPRLHTEVGGGDIHEMNAPHSAVEMDTAHKDHPGTVVGYTEIDGGVEAKHDSSPHEVHGSPAPVYEMPGSVVHEFASPPSSPTTTTNWLWRGRNA